MQDFIIPITRAHFDQCREVLRQHGVNVPDDNQGTLFYKSVSVAYFYDSAMGQLRIQVLSKPIILPAAKVEAAIRSWFKEKSI